MNDDDFLDIKDFFQYMSNIYSNSTRKRSKRRINRTESKGFRNENINVKRGRCTTDLIRDRETGETTGSNKKRNRIDTSDNFNAGYFIDET